MSTTIDSRLIDRRPIDTADRRRAATRTSAARRRSSAWLTIERPQGHRPAASSAARSLGLLASSVPSACCSASSASTATAPLLDDDALPQLFAGYRVGLVVRRACVPLLLGVCRRRRAAAARRPLAGLPAARRRRVLGLARRPRARRRRARQQRRPGRRQRRHGRPVPRRPRADASLGLTAVAASRRHVGAHHPGAGHAHAAGAAVLVVGAGRVARAAARAAGRCVGALDLPLRRPPLRAGCCSAATTASSLDRLRRSPSRPPTCSPCRPSASPPS